MSLINKKIKPGLSTVLVRPSLFLVFTALVSCSTGPTKPKLPEVPVKSEVAFDCFSINHAWGYQMSGFFIDSHGSVYRYKRQGSAWRPKPVLREKMRYYSENELATKFTEKTLVAKIDPAIMQHKVDMVDLADQGSVSQQKKKVADAGQSLCLAYVHGEGQNLYRPVALGSYGVSEKTITNSSVAAKSLLDWLTNDIAKKITGNPKNNRLSDPIH